MKALHNFPSFFLIILAIPCLMISSTPDFYSVAVYEHARLEGSSQDSQIQTNLKWYERVTILAKKQGADLILFPEYGLFPPLNKREDLKKHLEAIPNPNEFKGNPCNAPSLYSDRPVLYSLSCMAQKNKIVVVANMGGIERCEGHEDCPEDGDLHMNANVAFNKDGTLVGRYYKEHLFYEAGMDLPRQKQDPIFQTDFGKFAMFICFDIIWKKMSAISKLRDIDAILFSAMWMSSFPFYVSTPWFQAWAMGNNATLLAANVQIPRYLAAGSGIFTGNGAIASTFSYDGRSKLIVAAIPKRNKINLPPPQITVISENFTIKPWLEEDHSKNIPPTYSYPILGKFENNLKKLDNSSGHIELCHNGLCCELDYIANSMKESFYLGVYRGMHNSWNKYFWSEENCFLARCDDFNGTTCSQFPTNSETMFNKIMIRANFKSKVIYPWLVSNAVRLVPVKNWNFEMKNNKPLINFSNSSGIQILVAGFKGRVYDKDPPQLH